MKEAFWGYLIIIVGMTAIGFIFLFQTLTNTDEQLMTLLDETTKAAMYDAIDLSYYRENLGVRIDREKFVENFLRRFSENASLAKTYNIKIYDVNEEPPKVSLKVTTTEMGKLNSGGKEEELIEYTISNTLDAILETPYVSVE